MAQLGTGIERSTQVRVLVVDDSVDCAETLAMVLEQLGCETRVAHDGATALAQARDARPDVIFLDLSLPDMSGLELASQLRSWDGKQPVLIAVTGYADDDTRRASLRVGFDRHLSKPVRWDQLAPLLPTSRTA